MSDSQTFLFRYDRGDRLAAKIGLVARSSATRVEVSSSTVTVRMGWLFNAKISRDAIASAEHHVGSALGTRGVHGIRGRWLVNTSGEGLVDISIAPVGRARMLWLPVRLQRVTVSVQDPDGLIAAINGRSTLQ